MEEGSSLKRPREEGGDGQPSTGGLKIRLKVAAPTNTPSVAQTSEAPISDVPRSFTAPTPVASALGAPVPLYVPNNAPAVAQTPETHSSNVSRSFAAPAPDVPAPPAVPTPVSNPPSSNAQPTSATTPASLPSK
jgi:hypothetical protein